MEGQLCSIQSGGGVVHVKRHTITTRKYSIFFLKMVMILIRKTHLEKLF